MTYATCGFYFSEDLSKVVLIRKGSKPGLEQHEGLLNGVGGKFSLVDETILDCQEREFKEETGKTVEDWTWFDTGTYDDWTVYFFYAVGELDGISTQEDEAIEIHNTDDIDQLPVISNLKHLIPYALKLISNESI